MNIFDKGSVELILRHGIEKGYWSIEQLDFPTANFERQVSEARQSRFFGPDFVPANAYVNPLRKAPTVQVVAHEPEHDDLASAASAKEEPRVVDVLPAGGSAAGDPPVPRVSHEPDLSRDQNPRTDGGDHGHQGDLGTTGQHHPPSHGSHGTPTLQPQPTAEPLSTAPW